MRGYEATPFFVWAMYSDKEPDTTEYNVQKIIVNDSIIINNTTGFTPSTRFFLNTPLWYYISIKRNNNIDPTITFLQSKLKQRYSLIEPYQYKLFNDTSRINAFPKWFKNYVEEVSGITIHHLQIINSTVHIDNKKIITDSSFTVAEWK